MIEWLKKYIAKKDITPAFLDRSSCDVPNTPLASYLKYYVTLTAPGFAALVTGAWGVGKTYQVKQIIQESERYYVSLYGIDSVESIHDAVLAACLPNINANDFMAKISEVGQSAGDKYAIAGFASGAWKVFLRTRLKADRTLIFDDLERSTLWMGKKSELLGTINHYVEHRGFRVVVICHDESISQELAKFAEKTFGQTIRAVAQLGAALDFFIKEIEDEKIRTFIEKKRPLIENVWAQSGQSSLRILKHVLSDILRIHNSLRPDHLSNDVAIDQILRFFIALDIETRAGNLNENSLVERLEKHVGDEFAKPEQQSESGDAVESISKIIDRYPESELINLVLSDEIVVATLVEGVFDPAMITDWLDRSSYFATVKDTPPWKIVLQFEEMEDEILREGIELMNKQFDERSVTELGEFLHIAALRLMMAEENISGRTMEEEVGLCSAYIDDLLAAGKFPPKSLHYDPIDRISRGHDGNSYWVSDAARSYFGEILDCVDSARTKALEATYDRHALEVLRQLREQPSLIFSTISTTNENKDTLAFVPILAKISPKNFVDAWFSGPRNQWRQTSMALDNRYDHGLLDRHLKDEVTWLLELEKEIDACINAAKPIDAFRLRRLKPSIFTRLR
jgi:hypothetical protein